jgi:hypoxanthine phosphoribosyltransferase
MAVVRLAAQLDLDYRRRPPVLLGILKGGFVFMADLIRQMKTPLQNIEFLQVASYGPGKISSGRPRMVKGIPAKVISGRDVIVVEDIVDTGVTTAFILDYLGRRRPASLEVCALLDKPDRRQCQVSVKYVGLLCLTAFYWGTGWTWPSVTGSYRKSTPLKKELARADLVWRSWILCGTVAVVAYTKDGR